MSRYFDFDCPQTLYSVHRATVAERHRAYVGGEPGHPCIAPGMIARVEAAGYGVAALTHDRVRVTRGTVAVDAQWRRARPRTRDRMVARFHEYAGWNANRLARIAREGAERRADAEAPFDGEDLAQVAL